MVVVPVLGEGRRAMVLARLQTAAVNDDVGLQFSAGNDLKTETMMTFQWLLMKLEE